MRGRTNASNGGIFLNATTDTFEVATGNTIVAGDFCEYVYDTEIKTLTTATSTYDLLNVQKLDNGLYVASYLNYFTVLQMSSGVLSVINQTQYGVLSNTGRLCVMSNNRVAVISLDSSTYYLTVFSVASDGTVTQLAQESVGTTVSSAYNTSISYLGNMGGNVVACVHSSYLRSSATDTITLHAIDITDTSSVGHYSRNITSGMTYNNNFNVIGFGNNKVAYIIKGSSSSSGTVYYYEKVVTYNEGFEETVSTSITSSTFSSLAGNLVNYYPDDNKTYFYNGAGLFDASTDAFYSISYSTIGLSASIDKAINIGNNKAIIYSNSKYYQIEFNTASHSFTLLSDTPLSNESGTIVSVSLALGNVVLLSYYRNYSSTYTIRYATLSIDDSGNVELGGVTNTVQEWQGSGNPMGVAKQSGTAGDTIEVYIPATNV